MNQKTKIRNINSVLSLSNNKTHAHHTEISKTKKHTPYTGQGNIIILTINTSILHQIDHKPLIQTRHMKWEKKGSKV